MFLGGSPLFQIQSTRRPKIVRSTVISQNGTLGSQGHIRYPRFGFFCLVDRVARSKGISPFHGEAGLADLWRICRRNAGELSPSVVDDVEVAVGSGVIPQADIGADDLGICLGLLVPAVFPRVLPCAWLHPFPNRRFLAAAIVPFARAEAVRERNSRVLLSPRLPKSRVHDNIQTVALWCKG
jgi:hypothetical protein